MAKKATMPARISVKKRDPFRSFGYSVEVSVSKSTNREKPAQPALT